MVNKLKLTSFLLVCLLQSTAAFAVIETYEFDHDIQRERYNQFIEELRCPKCQNQNLSGSDAPIAKDLRRELHSQIIDGRSDQEITQFMVDRYGDFVLYRPQFSAKTAVLWLSPLVLLLIGALVWWSQTRKTGNTKTEKQQGTASKLQPLSDAEQQRLNAILAEKDD